MAASHPPSSPAPTTITVLSDDILREIFLCLPDVTSHARAAFACRAFLHAVRSSPKNAFLEFQTLSTNSDEQLPSRVVCVHHDFAWAWARVAVFSAHTMEWQVVLSDMETRALIGVQLMESDRYATGMVVNGFICWIDKWLGRIPALNTATFQFSRMDLPPPLKESVSKFQLGHTKDGKFCVVNVLQCMLSVWLWTADGDGVERFMLHKTFSLQANVTKITGLSEEADVGMQPVAVVNGFVYLSAYLRDAQSHLSAYGRDPISLEWFLSFCLETGEVELIYKETQVVPHIVVPYIMVSWPSSLINGKKDSKTGVTRNISKNDGHMGTKEAFHVHFTALQSFKEKLIDDGNLNFTEIDSFLLDDERNSLINRIATLESGLAAARHRVLRLGTEPNSMSVMELAGTRDHVLRIGTESYSIEGMDRVSWQMCKGMLGRACSRFFTG